MVLYIFNWTGVGMAVLTVLVFHLTGNPLVASIALIASDVAYRLNTREAEMSTLGALLTPRHGGHLLSVPCWIWGGVLLLFPRLLGTGPSEMAAPQPPPAVE